MAARRVAGHVGLLLSSIVLAMPVRAETEAPTGAATLDAEPAEVIAAQVEALPVPPLAPGQRGELSLVVLETPERGLPLALRIESSELELVDNRLGWSAVVDALALQPRLRASVRAPASVGRYEVHGSVEYWVCGQRWCRRKLGQITWIVAVEELGSTR